MTSRASKWWVIAIIVIVATGAGFFAWKHLQQPDQMAAFASGNGRIEATEVNISTKQSGRIKEVLAREGDDVRAGQLVARMDTAALEAGLHQAEAQIKQARHSAAAAAAVVSQRKSEKTTADALVAQRESQAALAEKDIQRTRQLIDRGFVSPQKLDIDSNIQQSAAAAVIAAKSQVMEARSAVEAAKAAVMQSQSAIEAATAAAEKIREDIRDAALVSPIAGRVLYRLAEPGEILGAGGNVLTVLDITDVYMTIFLPASQAGRVSIGTEARIVLDVRPDISIPASVTFVSPEAQFTPKSVETRTEREKLMFRIKVKIPQELLRAYAKRVKTGLPGIAYVRLSPDAPWPDVLPPLVNARNAR